MKIAYFDCFSGVSGDMILGALVDAGLALEDLRKGLSGLAIKGYELKAKVIHKGGLRATKVDVVTDTAPSIGLKTLADLEKAVLKSKFSEATRQKGLKVLKRLTQAESKAHGIPPHRLRLHGMDPVDTLVDVMGTAAGLELLGIQQVYSSPIHVGSGMKGLGPATAELLKGFPIHSSSTAHELATPTGAALLTTLVSDFSPLPLLTLKAVGYGAGTLDLLQGPNLLRVMIGEALAPQQPYESDRILQVETNIDDLSPQIYEHLMEQLLAAGALDVYFTPIVMKRGRLATQVSILTTHADLHVLLRHLFEETSTLGVRIQEVMRAKLPRAERQISTRFGKVRVKFARREAGRIDYVPEYQDCKEIAQKTGLPLRTVLDQVKEDARQAARKGKHES